MKRTFAEINLKKYRENLQEIKSFLNKKTKILAIIKANAYGFGAISIARACVEEKIDYLGVAWLTEAIELRLNGIKTPILLLSEFSGNYYLETVGLNITQTVYTKDFAAELNKAAIKLKTKAKVHIKIDTGMNRIGCKMEEALALIKYIQTLEHIEIEGIFTHFAQADNLQSEYTKNQAEKFQVVLNQLKNENIFIPLIHAANSIATFNYPKFHFDMVRIGIKSYQNILTLKTIVGFIKKIAPGTKISYDSTYETKKETNIATIMIGYADGLPRNLSNIGYVLIKEKQYPIVGNITMDMTMIDLGENPNQIKKGDEVVVLGKQGEKEITVFEIAKLTNKLPYEIFTSISIRVPRLYIT
ncbi:MAG: alanine racemase [Candidatus Margulisiibacteriota bacterium]|jgi:alanine racemase